MKGLLGYHCEMQDLLMVFLYDRHFFFTLWMNLVNNCTMCNGLMLSRINYFIVINFSDQKFSAWANNFFFFFTKRKNTQYSYYIYIYFDSLFLYNETCLSYISKFHWHCEEPDSLYHREIQDLFWFLDFLY